MGSLELLTGAAVLACCAALCAGERPRWQAQALALLRPQLLSQLSDLSL